MQKGGKMKLINIDTVRRIVDSPRNKTQMLAMLEQTPTIEIIMCKDCKYSHMTFDGECKYCDIWFPIEKTYMDGNYFCGMAERREDG